MIVDMNCCYKCEDRQILCHSSCERYAAMKEVRNRMREDEHNESVQDALVKRAMENFSKFHHQGRDNRKW